MKSDDGNSHLLPVRLPPTPRGGLGRGAAFFTFIIGKHAANGVHDELDPFVQFMIAKTQHVESARFYPRSSASIVSSPFRLNMLRAIELHNQLVGEANKVNDVRTNRGLAAKLSNFL